MLANLSSQINSDLVSFRHFFLRRRLYTPRILNDLFFWCSLPQCHRPQFASLRYTGPSPPALGWALLSHPLLPHDSLMGWSQPSVAPSGYPAPLKPILRLQAHFDAQLCPLSLNETSGRSPPLYSCLTPDGIFLSLRRQIIYIAFRRPRSLSFQFLTWKLFPWSFANHLPFE